ncbi:Uncharacterized SAM-binding protein YcdF, DUF218 family [Mariprofundus ferrinatatus]|uniref:Uncharacterized SAM-binding protein YcdF, DUF218 family n=1 Tax=Mariprofundus ferrinatatus TaxID=1921087 RepID=A0A2K8L301_9PROT|nr:YdcF family protein [Mariprofundus ferrinatatus]ATX81472.1 Uncharacterized SAM-binding protein YcdF, DUF218 family [Mariprofundus ferrinatatus]
MELLFSKLLSQLILPPGGLILLALIGLFFHRQLLGRLLIFFSLFSFWALSMEPVRDVLLMPLEQASPPFKPDQLPRHERLAVVVLGGGVYEQAPEFGSRDALKPQAMMRTIYAAELAKSTGLDVYASGGVVLTEGVEPEGVVMQRWLKRFGVAEEKIHVEASSGNTWENAANLKKLLAENDISTVILVTTAWHMPRSVSSFRAHGLKVIAAPCDFKVSRRGYDLRSALPRWDVFAESCDGLHEYLGMLWYRLKGVVREK